MTKRVQKRNYAVNNCEKNFAELLVYSLHWWMGGTHYRNFKVMAKKWPRKHGNPSWM